MLFGYSPPSTSHNHIVNSSDIGHFHILGALVSMYERHLSLAHRLTKPQHEEYYSINKPESIRFAVIGFIHKI